MNTYFREIKDGPKNCRIILSDCRYLVKTMFVLLDLKMTDLIQICIISCREKSWTKYFCSLHYTKIEFHSRWRIGRLLVEKLHPQVCPNLVSSTSAQQTPHLFELKTQHCFYFSPLQQTTFFWWLNGLNCCSSQRLCLHLPSLA